MSKSISENSLEIYQKNHDGYSDQTDNELNQSTHSKESDVTKSSMNMNHDSEDNYFENEMQIDQLYYINDYDTNFNSVYKRFSFNIENFPLLFIKSFNLGDIECLSELFHSCSNNNCSYEITRSLLSFRSSNFHELIAYYNSILLSSPDCTMQLLHLKRINSSTLEAKVKIKGTKIYHSYGTPLCADDNDMKQMLQEINHSEKNDTENQNDYQERTAEVIINSNGKRQRDSKNTHNLNSNIFNNNNIEQKYIKSLNDIGIHDTQEVLSYNSQIMPFEGIRTIRFKFDLESNTLNSYYVHVQNVIDKMK